MAIDKVIYELLKGYVGNRVYPLTMPENPTYPCMTYQQISHVNDPTVNVSYPTFQLDIWTQTYKENTELRDTIVNGIDRKKTVLLTYPIRVRYLDYFCDFESDTNLFHGVLDIQVFYKEV